MVARDATASPSSTRQASDCGRVFPARQRRSEQTRDRLLRTGTALLSSGGFDDVSIAQVAAAAGCSVGAFYERFRNKKAYFEFLLDSIIDQVRGQTLQTLTPANLRGLTLAQTVQACVRHHIQVVRAHEGPLRAALEYSINGSAGWQPVRDAAAWLNAHYIDLIMRKCRRDTEQRRAQLRIGLHVIAGHLLNVISHKPAVMPLEHPDLEFWLGSIVLHCLEARPPGRASTSGPASGPIP